MIKSKILLTAFKIKSLIKDFFFGKFFKFNFLNSLSKNEERSFPLNESHAIHQNKKKEESITTTIYQVYILVMMMIISLMMVKAFFQT
jgi:hypothetical protein